jgi:hypothetical protein
VDGRPCHDRHAAGIIECHLSGGSRRCLITADLDSGLTKDDLANELVGTGGGVTISDVSYIGSNVSAGTFTGGADIIGFDSGIILSTGKIVGVVGPNNDTNADHQHDGAGDADLTDLAGHETFNAAVLEFNFVPNGDKIFFDFVFSSDEYNEYVNKTFNDVFAFYVNGNNCALVDSDPVSINSINDGNPEPNENATASHPELFRNNSIKQEDGSYSYPINTGMDGLTVVLPCEAPVNPGVPNSMKLAIADSSDSALDSNVFIKAGSLTTIPPTPTPIPPTPTPTPSVEVGVVDHGDVHIRTPDGLVYDFQEVGDFILTQSTDGTVVLQARQTWWENNPKVSINTAVALNVDGVKLEFYLKPNRVFYIDDVETPLPTGLLQLSNGGSINLSGGAPDDFTILWPDGNTGARVVLHSNSHLDIGIARMNGTLTYVGVLGNLDRNASNDLTLRDGSQMTPPATPDQLNTFGASWLVPAGESLFDDTAENSVVEEEEEEPLTLFDLNPEDRAEARQTCENANVSDPLALDNCTYDVAATGDPIFVESAKT